MINEPDILMGPTDLKVCVKFIPLRAREMQLLEEGKRRREIEKVSKRGWGCGVE